MEHQIVYITLFHNDTYPKPSAWEPDVQVCTIYAFEVELYMIYN